jgi:hypothetical protein
MVTGMTRVPFLAGPRDFFLLHIIHVSSGAHSAPYPMGTGVLSLGVKWLGHEKTNHHLVPREKIVEQQLHRDKFTFLPHLMTSFHGTNYLHKMRDIIPVCVRARVQQKQCGKTHNV